MRLLAFNSVEPLASIADANILPAGPSGPVKLAKPDPAKAAKPAASKTATKKTTKTTKKEDDAAAPKKTTKATTKKAPAAKKASTKATTKATTKTTKATTKKAPAAKANTSKKAAPKAVRNYHHRTRNLLLTICRLPLSRKRSLSSSLRPRPAVSSSLPSLRRPRRPLRPRRLPPLRRLLRRNKFLHLAASSTSCHHRRLQQTLGRRLQGAQMACTCGCDTNFDPGALRRAH